MKSNHLRVLIAALLIAGLPRLATASGHGPVFGAATPTLGKGGWQLDQAWLGRLVEGPRTDEQTLRTMISFGLTEDLQISGSVPIVLDSTTLMPRGRVTAMMSIAKDAEALASWRFHRRASASGRVESTVTGGFSVPLEEFTPDGMQTAPGVHVSAATGYASRTHYAWVGSGYHYHAKDGQDQMGDVVFISGVYRYRPPAFQREGRDRDGDRHRDRTWRKAGAQRDRHRRRVVIGREQRGIRGRRTAGQDAAAGACRSGRNGGSACERESA